MKNPNQKSWDRHAQRYYKENPLPFDVVDYCGANFPTENDLHLIGDVSGLKILELGAGSCNCGIALAKQGADVTCLDSSEKQLKIGKQNEKEQGVLIQTVYADFHDLQQFKSSEYDLVLSICAFQYAEDIGHIFKEVERILKNGGKFIFSVDHPIMKAIEASFLYPDEENLHKDYHFIGQEKWKWEEEDDFWFVTYRRPVSDYLNSLISVGFKISKVADLYPKKKLVEVGTREQEVASRFPSILVIRAEK